MTGRIDRFGTTYSFFLNIIKLEIIMGIIRFISWFVLTKEIIFKHLNSFSISTSSSTILIKGSKVSKVCSILEKSGLIYSALVDPQAVLNIF